MTEPEPSATAKPDTSFAVIPKAIPLTPPQGASEQLLGLAPDIDAAKRLRDALAATGLAFPEEALYVLPVRGGQETILFVAFGDASGGFFTNKEMLPALISAAAADPSRITRLTLDIRGQDSKGRFILTMTAPLAAMKAMAAGDKSLDLPKQIVYSLNYEGQ